MHNTQKYTSLLVFLFLYNVDVALSALIDRGINKKYAEYSWCETGNIYTLIYMSKNSIQQWRKLTPVAKYNSNIHNCGSSSCVDIKKQRNSDQIENINLVKRNLLTKGNILSCLFYHLLLTQYPVNHNVDVIFSFSKYAYSGIGDGVIFYVIMWLLLAIHNRHPL